MATSFFGTFMISYSTRAARQGDTPTRWADYIHTRTCYLRYRPCGRIGRERRSISPSRPPRIQSRPRRRPSFCVNVVRCAPLMTGSQSHSPSLQVFSLAPRGCNYAGKADLTSAIAVQWLSTRQGRNLQRAAAMNWNFIWLSIDARASRGASITMTQPPMRSPQSRCARTSLKPCWRALRLQWTL